MSITKSYNKQTGIYYAYETTYEWSDEKQKKVQRKRCIGHFDPQTGEVVPNGKVGRPSRSENLKTHTDSTISVSKSDEASIDPADLAVKLSRLEEKAHALSTEIHVLIEELQKSSVSNE
jgi:hypothetical protein